MCIASPTPRAASNRGTEGPTGMQSNQNPSGISFLPNATQTQAIGLTSIIGAGRAGAGRAGARFAEAAASASSPQTSSSLTAPQQTSITQGALARRRQRRG